MKDYNQRINYYLFNLYNDIIQIHENSTIIRSSSNINKKMKLQSKLKCYTMSSSSWSKMNNHHHHFHHHHHFITLSIIITLISFIMMIQVTSSFLIIQQQQQQHQQHSTFIISTTLRPQQQRQLLKSNNYNHNNNHFQNNYNNNRIFTKNRVHNLKIQSTLRDKLGGRDSSYITMVKAIHDGINNNDTSTSYNKSNDNNNNNNNNNNNDYDETSYQIKSSIEKTKAVVTQTKNKKQRRKKYKRKRPKTQSEKELQILKQTRQEQYEQLMSNGNNGNIWDFESLFPAPTWDEKTIHRDLYEVAERDASVSKKMNDKLSSSLPSSSSSTSSSSSSTSTSSTSSTTSFSKEGNNNDFIAPKVDNVLSQKSRNIIGQPYLKEKPSVSELSNKDSKSTNMLNNNSTMYNNSTKVDRSLTRMVEDRLYGFRRGQMGEFEYDTSLMGDGAVKFRDGVRLGKALKVNADRLTYFAKREMIHGKLEEAEELYEKAIAISPQDGRGYLGLARIFERRRDLKSARDCLRAGIAKSRLDGSNGANPFLLQALGRLEENSGHLSEAESLYIAAAKSRPSHAAAWVSLAQLRTKKLRQGPNAGRVCYQTAERELQNAGLPPSSYVYAAWGGLECNSGNIRKARDLFQKALDVDPKCSAAWLQLGVMEADAENWDKAKNCFETVLKFDNRNSRVLQAYALMETKRPDGNSRDAIGLFEKALRANPRDGGVLQAYGLYVAQLGDIDSARDLLRRGTQIDKRHAPLWQAWGVLETRHGSAAAARDVFQQGIWACAQSSGGQSGGRHCARLWQAWGVLEAKECDYAAARRCFSRALDADNRNVAAITAWTLMEQELGRFNDAKLIFERSLRQFTSASDDKLAIWRAYELMEIEAGNLKAAQNVYQRSIRDSIGNKLESSINYNSSSLQDDDESSPADKILKESSEVEVSRWNTMDGFGNSDVWMKDGSIEGKVPASAMNKGQKPSMK